MESLQLHNDKKSFCRQVQLWSDNIIDDWRRCDFNDAAIDQGPAK